jgi:hypothetical protein
MKFDSHNEQTVPVSMHDAQISAFTEMKFLPLMAVSLSYSDLLQSSKKKQ